ncbi:MAG: ABC transporter ATP-binding protein [Verrucomicrobia bacterium]|nr:ABC transporter ATP-binding protein [Verrucomicrobiota bacterium]
MSTMLHLENIFKSYASNDSGQTLNVLKGVSLDANAGESLAIVGPSGSGKSTLLHIMGTLDTASQGEVHVDGRNVAGLPEKALANMRISTIGFVFQNHYLLPQLNVVENVLVPLLAVRTPTSQDRDRAKSLLNRVGLKDRMTHRPGQLSGGECQRVAVVRAMINTPKILLADEPTGALDERNANALADLLFEFQLEHGLTMVMVTHAPSLAARAGQQRYMQDGILASTPA